MRPQLLGGLLADWHQLSPRPGIDSAAASCLAQSHALSWRGSPCCRGTEAWPCWLKVGPVLVSELLRVGSAEAVVRPAWLNFSLCAFLLPSCDIIKKEIWSLSPVPNVNKVFF